METLNHRIQAGIWGKAFQFDSSMVWVFPRIVIDVDSTVKIVCGNQQGVFVGYNHHKCAIASYHPILAFMQRQRKFFKAGLEVESSVPAVEWLNLCGNSWLISLIKPSFCFVDTVSYSKRPYMLTILCDGWRFAAEIKFCNAGRWRLYELFSSEWQENERRVLVNKN